ncbi:UDP-N-acetylglucosamine 2-epimerase [Planktomarina temperata]|nr:UDP-N-acetylglucosamine 2-epimerase [Planktomarina temperata]
MSKKLKVCAVTGSRAEFGLMKNLLLMMQTDDEIDLQVIVTGMHLSPEFGSTWREIEDHGLTINKKIDMLIGSESKSAVSKSIGVGLISFSDAFEELNPDLVVVLGDRFEILSAGIAAMIADIPLAHLHGGEITHGLYDDPIRHSLSKMSLLHFVSTEKYRKRVIQLGEDPDRVFNVGAFGLDQISECRFLTRKELSSKYNFNFSKKYLLVTFHAETLSDNKPLIQLEEMLKAISLSNINAVFTMSNADNEGRLMNKRLKAFAESDTEKYIFIESMGSTNYLSAIKYCACVVGNSSSGLIEVPSFGKPTVNIGRRQGGRAQSRSVINCSANAEAITNAIMLSQTDEFTKLCSNVKNVYGEPGAAMKTLKIIKAWNPLKKYKEFYSL